MASSIAPQSPPPGLRTPLAPLPHPLMTMTQNASPKQRLHPQDDVYARSLADPEGFWLDQADRLKWHVKPTRALCRGRSYSPQSLCLHPPAGTTPPAPASASSEQATDKHWPWSWSWFPDGELNTCENMIDRHVGAGNGDQLAVIWDSPVDGGAKEKYTYAQLKEEVELLAGVMREEGVQKGDVVLLYMPMIPAALFAMLATIRLGAIHAVVFGGFAPASLAQRIDSAHPKMIMTASCAIEGTKGPLAYKALVHEAIDKAAFKPPRTVIWQRDRLRWDNIRYDKGERDWIRSVKGARMRGVKADCVPIKSTDGLYIIYTSGTTGTPKGVVREAGGHAVGLNLSIKHLYGMRGPGDVMFCASDVGWVVGHSYILYGPLLCGATTVLFEGKPVGTPDASTFWRIVDEYQVSVLSTAPTALRAITRADPDSTLMARIGDRGGLRSLRAIFLAGERSEPSIVELFQKRLRAYAAPGATVVDNWWTSEAGSPMTGIALAPESALSRPSTARPLPIRPGSAGKPLPGFDVRVVDDSGAELPRGSMGNLVLAMPLAPTALTTLWRDPDRFYKSYVGRFSNGLRMDEQDHWWIDTGDAGMVDTDGYVHVMSRSDDIINVAAHRFGSGALEQAVVSADPRIAEACVVGVPDELKGHLPFALVTLKNGVAGDAACKDAVYGAAQKAIRAQIGAIACLGGMIVLEARQGLSPSLPKTRSGKTLRRLVRQLVEQAAEGRYDAEVTVPSTIEDADAVGVVRGRVREYFVARKQARARL